MTKERDYAFGFHDDVKPLFSTGKGMTVIACHKESCRSIG